AIGSAINSQIQGADTQTTFRNAIVAGLSAAAFSFAGDVGKWHGASPVSEPTRWVAKVVTHGVIGCAQGKLSGGTCRDGAIGAAASAGTTFIGQAFNNDPITQGVVQAIIGGASASASGGRFEIGATTAAFGYLFNCVAHECLLQGQDAERAFVGWLRDSGTALTLGLSFNRAYDSANNFFWGRPDVFSESMRMVWDVKPLSVYGMNSGEFQMFRYTLNGEYVPGNAAILGGNSTVTVTGAMNRYEMFYGGNGLIMYRALDPSPWERNYVQPFKRALEEDVARKMAPLSPRRPAYLD
ncbi:MAG: hypothetical protein EOP50_19440, partial [Sphingobacteriales bacterium]